MKRFRYFNSNPAKRNVGDCAVRALCKATGQSWERVYTGLCLQGFMAGDMPNANTVWGAYLRGQGWKRYVLTCPDCYTVNDFTREHPQGVYVLALDGHVVCVQNGILYDTWNSGAECPLYYWTKEQTK